MAGLNGPDSSQSIPNMNTVPSALDMSTQQDGNGNDMALFTNSEVYDFELGGGMAELGPFPGDYPVIYPTIDPANQPSGPAYAAIPASTLGYPQPPPTMSSTSSPNHLPLINPTASTSTPMSPSASHLTAEEDKRRRNTLASARFRSKKKEREQALERESKQLKAKAKVLEKRAGELQTENAWLKGLLMERDGVVGP